MRRMCGWSRSARPGQWDGRGHFFAAAAEAMRRILVENARRKRRLKHGGQRQSVPVADVAGEDEDSRLLALDDALTRLAAEDRQAAQVVRNASFRWLKPRGVARSLGLTVYRVRQNGPMPKPGCGTISNAEIRQLFDFFDRSLCGRRMEGDSPKRKSMPIDPVACRPSF